MRRRPLEFEVSDNVSLKVNPKRGVVRFGKRGKLSPRFIGSFEILERMYTIAYRLALPPSMLGVHEVFHVSMLRKYTPDPAHVVDWGQVEVDTDGTFEEGPVCILDSRDQVLRCKTVRLVRVLGRHCGVEESTWKREDTMRATYPFLFRDEGTWFSRLRFKLLVYMHGRVHAAYACLIKIVSNFGTKFLLRRGECKTREISISGIRSKL